MPKKIYSYILVAEEDHLKLSNCPKRNSKESGEENSKGPGSSLTLKGPTT